MQKDGPIVYMWSALSKEVSSHVFVIHAVVFPLDDEVLLASQGLVAILARMAMRMKVEAFD